MSRQTGQGAAVTISAFGGVRMGWRAGALATGVMAALAGCVSDPNEYAPQCPMARLRPDAAMLTRYDGRGTDLTDLVMRVRLQNIQGACSGIQGGRHMKARAHLEMIVSRGPAARGRDVDVLYNVAVMHNGALLEKRPLVAHVTFPPNTDTVAVTGEEVKFQFNTSATDSGPNYKIFFFLQLTPEELAANQRDLEQGGPQ